MSDCVYSTQASVLPALTEHLPALTEHLRRYSMEAMGVHSSSVLQASLLIPLHKNAKGDIRPIAVASVWRKLQALLALLTWGDSASSALGYHQHGIQQQDGAAQFALKLSRRAECHPKHAFLQYDLSDAFN
eukprot:3244224-Amphidinium_carterae.1